MPENIKIKIIEHTFSVEEHILKATCYKGKYLLSRFRT